jgi:hypothetical protein
MQQTVSETLNPTPLTQTFESARSHLRKPNFYNVGPNLKSARKRLRNPKFQTLNTAFENSYDPLNKNQTPLGHDYFADWQSV